MTESCPTEPAQAPRPKSPPAFPDLEGKRKHMAKVQMLEREIGFLQEELKTMEESQPASRSCKEVADFVVANSDPFMPIKNRKTRNASSGFWSWLCGMACFNSSCVCCSCRSECSCHLNCPSCCIITCHSCFRSMFQCVPCSNLICCCRSCFFGLPSSCFNCSNSPLCCSCTTPSCFL